jgi:hypothetical protein
MFVGEFFCGPVCVGEPDFTGPDRAGIDEATTEETV